MTTFLCHVTTSFGHHVISFLQPTVQNSNGGFTTLVILIVIFFLGGRGGGGGIFWFMKLWVVHDCSMGNSLCKNRPFAGSGHMIRNKLRGTQITEWDFQNKGKSGCTGKDSFVFKVPLRHLRPSVIYSVPCDRILRPDPAKGVLFNIKNRTWIVVTLAKFLPYGSPSAVRAWRALILEISNPHPPPKK